MLKCNDDGCSSDIIGIELNHFFDSYANYLSPFPQTTTNASFPEALAQPIRIQGWNEAGTNEDWAFCNQSLAGRGQRSWQVARRMQQRCRHKWATLHWSMQATHDAPSPQRRSVTRTRTYFTLSSDCSMALKPPLEFLRIAVVHQSPVRAQTTD